MKQYTEMMVDTEYMGDGPDAALVSIGAVKFNLNEVQTVESILPEQRFYVNIDLQSSIAAGMTTEASTVQWWSEQAEEARAVLLVNPLPLAEALRQFEAFIDGQNFWGNGPAFDNAIVRSGYRLLGRPLMEMPWNLRKDRCYRTIIDLMERLVPEGQRPEKVRHGTLHNALDDAITQAIYAQKCFAALKALSLPAEIIG